MLAVAAKNPKNNNNKQTTTKTQTKKTKQKNKTNSILVYHIWYAGDAEE